MEHARHRSCPPNGYFASAFSFISNPRPGFSGSGNRPFTMRIAGKPSHSSQTFSFVSGCNPAADLLNQKVRRRRIDMDGGEAADRTFARMRRHGDARQRRHLADLP